MCGMVLNKLLRLLVRPDGHCSCKRIMVRYCLWTCWGIAAGEERAQCTEAVHGTAVWVAEVQFTSTMKPLECTRLPEQDAASNHTMRPLSERSHCCWRFSRWHAIRFYCHDLPMPQLRLLPDFTVARRVVSDVSYSIPSCYPFSLSLLFSLCFSSATSDGNTPFDHRRGGGGCRLASLPRQRLFSNKPPIPARE